MGFQVLTVTPCCSHNYNEHGLTNNQKKEGVEIARWKVLRPWHVFQYRLRS